jgi:hypothetical protein
MNSKIDHENPLTKRAVAWKHKQAIISLSIEEMEKKLGEDTAVIEQKVDGQSVIMDYRDDKAQFATLDGRLMWDIPVLNEIESILKKNKISQAQMMGELASMESGKILGFNQSMSIIRNPGSDKNKISWHPYQILNMNGKEIPDDLESYRESWIKIKSLFAGAKHVKPVDYSEGGSGVLKKSWDKLVLKEENEGLVIRTKDGKVYKAKPTFTYDLVIVAVGDKTGKNWPKKRIGTALMAFMDNNGIFRTAGEVASGFTHVEQTELYSWAQENKVGEDNHYVWVRPSKIMEIQWERTTIKEMKAYSYSKGKYEPKGKLMSGTIVKPRFIRWRTDKSVTPADLRLTQVPNWEKTKKMAMRVASAWIHSSMDDALENIISEISEKDHITILDKPFGTISAKPQTVDFKPNGLWYSCGKEWIEWVLSEQRSWVRPYVYRLHLSDSKIIKISNKKELEEFTKKYLKKDHMPGMETSLFVDWPKVASEYDGIQICPYIHSARMSQSTEWYYSWDVASGCIWNPSAVTKAELLYVYDKESDEYKKPKGLK